MTKARAKAEARKAARSRRIAVGFALFAGIGSGGCTDWAGYDLDYFWDAIPALSTMRGSLAYDPYDMPRLPAPNSVPASTPNGDTPAPFSQARLDSAAATLVNPFAGRADAALLARGQSVYLIQCAACHGPEGAGNGPVVGPGKYPFAPAINAAATAARSDGYLYGVITVGRGLMPPYGPQITNTDRWAVVSYVRQLQGRTGGVPATVPGVPTVVNPPDTLPGGAPVVDTTGQGTQQ